MISVLCASRSRVGQLQDSLLSLGDGCEFMVAIDEDDPQKADYLAIDKPNMIVSKRFGYDHLEDYYNLMATAAHGDWLMNWNDDALMQTDGWQENLAELDPEEMLVVYFEGCKHFPIMSRGMYETVGHFSIGPSIDSYLLTLGDFTDAIRVLPEIQIAHQPSGIDHEPARARYETPSIRGQIHGDAAKVWMKK